MTPLPCDLSNSPCPDWLHDFEVALHKGQIPAAKAAVFSRLKMKAECPPGILERIQLNDAIYLLRTLRSAGIA